MVTWHDAHSDRCAGWVQAGDIDQDPWPVRSIGWLIEPSKAGHVSIARSHTEGDDLDHVLHIPSGMVQTVEPVQPSRFLQTVRKLTRGWQRRRI